MKNILLKKVIVFYFILTLLLPINNTYAKEIESELSKYEDSINEGNEKINLLIKHILSSYYGEGNEDLNVDILYEAAIKGMFEELDEYSEYYSKEEWDKYAEMQTGKSYGLGVSVSKVANGLIVNSIIEDSGAQKAGIQVNDIIISADGIDLSNFTLDEAVNVVKGEKGTLVEIIVNRAGSLIKFEVERCEIKENPIVATLLSEITNNEIDKNTLYMSISNFNGNTGEFFYDEMDKYENQNVEKMILDLRNNPGGLMDEALKVASYFLDKDEKIVTLRDKLGNETTFSSKTVSNMDKVVVLINGHSASASELLTAALRENEKSLVIGESSFGKSIAQTLFSHNGLNYKMTTEEYFTPNNNSIAKVGIKPDEIIESPKYIYDVKYKYFGGEKSEDIISVKSMLKFLGYDIKDESDVYDNYTFEQVKKFQFDNNLGSYGGIDYTTQRTLNKAALEKSNEKDIQLEKAIEVIRYYDKYIDVHYKNEIE